MQRISHAHRYWFPVVAVFIDGEEVLAARHGGADRGPCAAAVTGGSRRRGKALWIDDLMVFPWPQPPSAVVGVPDAPPALRDSRRVVHSVLDAPGATGGVHPGIYAQGPGEQARAGLLLLAAAASLKQEGVLYAAVAAVACAPVWWGDLRARPRPWLATLALAALIAAPWQIVRLVLGIGGGDFSLDPAGWSGPVAGMTAALAAVARWEAGGLLVTVWLVLTLAAGPATPGTAPRHRQALILLLPPALLVLAFACTNREPTWHARALPRVLVPVAVLAAVWSCAAILRLARLQRSVASAPSVDGRQSAPVDAGAQERSDG